MLKPTPTHERILALLAEGWTAKEVAGKLRVTPGAVKQAIYRLREHFGARSTIQLVVKYVTKSQ